MHRSLGAHITKVLSTVLIGVTFCMIFGTALATDVAVGLFGKAGVGYPEFSTQTTSETHNVALQGNTKQISCTVDGCSVKPDPDNPKQTIEQHRPKRAESCEHSACQCCILFRVRGTRRG